MICVCIQNDCPCVAAAFLSVSGLVWKTCNLYVRNLTAEFVTCLREVSELTKFWRIVGRNIFL